MTKLVLIRHGETDDNKGQFLCGWSDPCLNEYGRQAAEELSSHMRRIKLDAIIYSGLQRAEETAYIIGRGRDIPIFVKESFKELNFGVFEGLRMKDIEMQQPELYKELERDFINFRFPEGESLYDMNKRVVAAIEALVEEYRDNTVALVAHSGVIRCILAHYITGDINKHWSFKVEHCSLSVLELHEGFPVLTKLNDIVDK